MASATTTSDRKGVSMREATPAIEELDDFEAPFDHWLVRKIIGSILIIVKG